MKPTSTLYDIRTQMFRHGGAFVRSLAQTMGHADLENQARIVAAFPDVIERYDALAMKANEEQAMIEEVVK